MRLSFNHSFLNFMRKSLMNLSPPSSICVIPLLSNVHIRTYELIMQNPAKAVKKCQNNERSQFLFIIECF